MLKACCAAPPAELRRRGAGQADGAPEPRLTGIAMGKLELEPEPEVDPLAFAQVLTATASAHSNFRAKHAIFKVTVEKWRRDSPTPLTLQVRRDTLLPDAYRAFEQPEFAKRDDHGALANLRLRPLRVTFAGEAGVDEGGVRREFFAAVSRAFVDADFALFKQACDNDYTYQINELSGINPDHLHFFELFGKVLAMAVIQEVPLEVRFNSGFYRQLLGLPLSFDDLEAIDRELYVSLRWIEENDPAGLDFFFSTNVDHFGLVREVDLVENGRDVEVTEENKAEFVKTKAEWRMETQTKEQMQAIRRGFNDVFRDTPDEVQTVRVPRHAPEGTGMSIAADGTVARWVDPTPPKPRPGSQGTPDCDLTVQVPRNLGQSRLMQFNHNGAPPTTHSSSPAAAADRAGIHCCFLWTQRLTGLVLCNRAGGESAGAAACDPRHDHPRQGARHPTDGTHPP